MARIKITIPVETEEHASWAEALRILEDVPPEFRTDEQWEAIRNAYEREPVYGPESEEHSQWRQELLEAEENLDRDASEANVAALAALNAAEPAFGKIRTYYIPTDIPADKISRLPVKELKEKGGSYDFTVELLSLYMPRKAAESLTMQQMATVNRGIFGLGE